MKNHLLTIISIVLLTGCHLKKKTAEINAVDQQTISQIAKDIQNKADLKIVQVDSSKIIKSNIENLNYSKSFDIEFELTPHSEKAGVLTDKNDSFIFNQLLNQAQKVKLRFNHTTQKFHSQLLTSQNYIQSQTDSSVSKKHVYKEVQKTDIKKRNKLSSESKTYTTLMWWVLAAVILVTVYFLNKFNIHALILRLFKL